MKKLFLLVVLLAAKATTGCVPTKRMDAYVALAHPGAREITRLGPSARQIYVLCEEGAMVLVNTDRTLFTADILETVKLDTEQVTCK